jgi:AcrR family transcriptional regulator
VARFEGGARERKKRATQAQLEEAAFSLFSEQGYDATTVDEISEAAQVSPRTFFRYFATKEDVIFRDREGALGELRDALERGPAEDRAALGSALIAFSEFLEGHREGVLSRRELVSKNPSLQSRVLQEEHNWAAALAAALARRAGRDAPTFDEQVLAGCAISVLASSLQEWTGCRGSAPLPEFTQRALDAVGGLFGAPAPSNDTA